MFFELGEDMEKRWSSSENNALAGQRSMLYF